MKAVFYTLGCKVNQYETQAMRQYMKKAGFDTDTYETGHTDNCDVIVINSCTVTAESDRKLRQLVRRARREHPTSVLVVTGCMPQAFPDEADTFSEADIVLGNAARKKLPQYVAEFFATHQRIVDIPPHSAEYEPLEISAFEEHTRAFIKIEDGCNRFCTYCIIPYARGRVRSRDLDDLKTEAQALAAKGYRELVLVGINLTAFGQDTGHTIADAVETVCAIDGIARVRLGSIEPDYLTAPIIERLAAQPKLCPQFHLALQSGCDATLKRMNRHYTTAEYLALCNTLRAAFPHCAITTDFMVGFPDETEEEFAASLQFLQTVQFARVHIFAYSPRAGTVAAKSKGQLSGTVKTARSRRATAVCAQTAADYADSFIGNNVAVLLETPMPDGTVFGYTPAYVGVYVKTNAKSGEIVTVHITHAANGECYGTQI